MKKKSQCSEIQYLMPSMKEELPNQIKTLETDLKKEREMRTTLEQRLTTLESKLTSKSNDSSLGKLEARINDVESNSKKIMKKNNDKTSLHFDRQLRRSGSKKRNFGTRGINNFSSFSTSNPPFPQLNPCVSLPPKTASLFKKLIIKKN